MAVRMLRIILSSWCALVYDVFPHFLINGMVLEKTNLLNIKVTSFCITPDTFFILRRTERAVIKMYIGFHVKCALLSDLNEI
jgi:hypothetical protein